VTKLNAKALRRPLVDLIGLESEQLTHVFSVECGVTTLPSQGVQSLRLVHSLDEPIRLQTDKDGYPELPNFLDRRKPRLRAAA
jgi:hypothetical protein